MTARTDKIKREAQEVETRLRAAGLHMDADAVARLRKGYACALGNLKAAHRGNRQPVASAPATPPPPRPQR